MFKRFRDWRKARLMKRMYAAAKHSRLTTNWGRSDGSADSELSSSLTTLRSRCRQLVRDSAYAKRAKMVIVNNVVGVGIGLQAQVATSRGELNDRINDDIESAWKEWTRATSCHTGGALHFADIERLAIGQVFEAGEILIRKHYGRFGQSSIPFALEIIEPERLANEYQHPDMPAAAGATVRMGIEADEFGRPLAYWVRQRHPGELRQSAMSTEKLERVPASDIIHLRIIDRWPQTRGEPWLHAVARRLNDMDGYSEAEIIAARGAANIMATIESENFAPEGVEQDDGTFEMSLEPGTVRRLRPGEKFNGFSPNRPNSALDPFLRYMLREVASGANISYESLSRDYSQTNYSSSRLALIEDRDMWRVLQLWFIRNFRDELHREWMQQAVLSGAIRSIDLTQYATTPSKFEKVSYKPRGWSWIDPKNEVESYVAAVNAGFTTVGRVISATAEGADLEDILTEREHELQMMKDHGLTFTTDSHAQGPPDPAPSQDDDQKKPLPERVLRFGGLQ